MTPIINGKGFAFKEPQVAEANRLDVAITYNNTKEIIELKRWYGPKAHQRDLNQLYGYLEKTNLSCGYLMIFQHNIVKREYKHEWLERNGKKILAVWV